jgi:hypothetical protein
MSLTEKTTHAAESVARLLSQFKGMTKIEGVVSAQGDQAQDEETALYDLLDLLNIDVSVGAQLDGIGTIVGEERKGRTDAVYRIYLKGRILANRSSGTPPELNEIAHLLVGDANNQVYREYYPAAWKITVDDEFPTDPDAVAELLSDARVGGVNGFVEYTDTDDAHTFTFADADAIQADVLRGFADDGSQSEMIVNGDFASWTADDPDNWTVANESAPTRECSEVGTGELNGGTGTGSCNLYSSSGNLYMSQVRALTNGANYIVTLTISAISGTLRVYEGSRSDYDENYTTVGDKEITFVAGGASGTIQFRSNVADATIDDMSLKLSGGAWADVVEA